MIELWNLALSIRTIFSIVLAFAASIIVFIFYSEYVWIWVFSVPLFFAKIINPTLFCNALEENKFVFKIGFFSKLIFLILIFLSHKSAHVNFYLALSEIAAIFYYLRKIHPGFFTFKWASLFEIKLFLKQTFNLFLMNFLLLLKPNAILPVVSYLLGFEAAALFSIAHKVINVIKSISGTMFASFFPIYNKEKYEFNVLSIQTGFLILFLSLLSVVGFWYLSPYVIYVLNDFKTNLLAIKTLRFLSLSIPIFFLNIPLFIYLLNHKKWNTILNFSIVQLAVLVGCLWLLLHDNLIGVAKSLVVSEYTLFLCYVVYVFNAFRLNKLKKQI